MSRSKYDNRNTYLLISFPHCTSLAETELLEILLSVSLQSFVCFPISNPVIIKDLFSDHKLTFPSEIACHLEDNHNPEKYRIFLFRSTFYLLKILYRNIYYTFLEEGIKSHYFFLSEEED